MAYDPMEVARATNSRAVSAPEGATSKAAVAAAITSWLPASGLCKGHRTAS